MDIKKVFAYTVGVAKLGIGIFAGVFPAISLMLFEFSPKGPEQQSLLHLSRFFGVREFAMGCGLLASHGTQSENLVLNQLLLSDTVDFVSFFSALSNFSFIISLNSSVDCCWCLLCWCHQRRPYFSWCCFWCFLDDRYSFILYCFSQNI